MNAALLRSVYPVSCGLDPHTHHGLGGFVAVSPVSCGLDSQTRDGLGGFVVPRTAACCTIVRKQRGFWVAANSSRAPWLPPRVSDRPVRHWELLVTTNWRDVDVAELRALLTGTKQNCDQFPKLNPDGSIETEVSPVKLKRAIQHSFIVVAMYIRGPWPFPSEDYFADRPPGPNRTLVAFARATSDHALTASIHDVAVAPALQGGGIGRRLMQRMVREICRYDIADISVMAEPRNRPFFRACGFGSDVLGSTAMMYTACELVVPESRKKEAVSRA